MGDNWNDDLDDDFEDQTQGDGPADLRKAHRAATRKAKELEKQLADLAEQNKVLLGQVRGKSITDLLQAKGVNPKVAKLVPSDVDASEESLNKWLDEYADALNITVPDSASTAQTDGASREPSASEPAEDISQDDLAALSEALSVGSQGSAIPAGAASALLSDVENNARTQDDLFAILQKHGIEVKQGY